jgi:hypothetical protein
VAAAAVGAGVLGAALADLALRVYGNLPGLAGDLAERGALAFAQFPPDRVNKLVAGPGGEGVQALDQPVAGPGSVAGDHQPPPEKAVPSGQYWLSG